MSHNRVVRVHASFHNKEAGRFAKAGNLGGKREVMNVLQRVVELHSLVSTIFEAPKVVVCVPQSLSLIMIGERIQGSPILTAVSWNDAYDMGIRAHDDSSVACWDASPLAVSDDTRDKVVPTIEVES